MALEKAPIGSDVKFIVDISSPGFDMSRDDFSVTLTRGAVSNTYNKSDMAVDPEGNYYFCFSTEDYGKGLITATVTAQVPDEDFDDGTRTEIEKFDLLNVVSL